MATSKRFPAGFSAISLVALILAFLCPAQASMPSRAAIESVIAKVKPALVRIQVVTTYYEEGREMKYQSVGSGVIITKEGHLVTNHHVAGHGKRFFCTLSNREEIEAELVGTDPLTDIAVLKLKPSKPRTFPTVSFGDSSKAKVSDPVLAMGSPMALSQSVTAGIISNVEMIMPKFFGSRARIKMDGEDVGLLVRWIAHDAAIYGGNSGGPLVNLKGEVIGINEISLGLSGAIPGNLAKYSVKEIMDCGRVRRAWLGIEIQPLLKTSSLDRGVLISGVIDESPAATAGLKAGDILVNLNRAPVHARYDEEVPELVGLICNLGLDRDVPAVVLRDGKEIKVQLKTVERTELRPPEHEIKQWGVTVRDISFIAAKEMKRKSQDGAFITSVRTGGPAGAAKPSLATGDIITEVNGTAIHNVRELIDLTEKLTGGKSQPVPALVAFEEKTKRFLTVVKIGIEDIKDPGLEVTKAWLPVETQAIGRDIARQLGQPNLQGYCITHVYAHSTAEKAGLKPGDFIVSVDDEKLTAFAPEHEDDLATLIRQYDVGATVQLGIVKDSKKKIVPVELSRSPRLRREMRKYRNDEFEFTVRDLTFFDRADEQWNQEQSGALVEEVKSGSWAELATLEVNDLILEIDAALVDNVESVRKQMERIATDKPGHVVMKVLRGIHTRFLEFQPKWKTD